MPREALLALDEDAFDQDKQGGWRQLETRSECALVAADLIRDYLNSGKRLANEYLLLWHEGQLRAREGQTEQAIALFKRSHMKPHPQLPDSVLIAWNSYADATIAFLRNDRAGLLAARDAIRKLPPQRDPNGNEFLSNGKPYSLYVVDGLVACLGLSYKAGYSQECSARAPN